ncbi:hypothetical protein P692DRAFT_20203678 [Suillus brevipes Sb2]|nr:hypothetical protein P692DRAFT_20203678 [Suillus brevipes Sb2]
MCAPARLSPYSSLQRSMFHLSTDKFSELPNCQVLVISSLNNRASSTDSRALHKFLCLYLSGRVSILSLFLSFSRVFSFCLYLIR